MMISRKDRMVRNRKGEDMLVDFFAVLVFALIILIFFIMFSYEHSKAQNNAETRFNNKDTNYMLESFLRSPAVYVDDKKTVSQIMLEDSVTQDYKRTTDLFNKYFSQVHTTDGFRLTIETDEDTATIKIKRTIGSTFYDKILITITSWVAGDTKYAETYIPGPDGAGGSKIHIILEKDESITSG